MICALESSILPWFVRYPPILGNSCFHIFNRVSIAPSRISRDGRCGRKSLPTKKMRSTQSSIACSRLKGKGVCGTLSSTSRYSRRIAISRNMNGFFFGRNDLVSYFCLHSCTLGCKVTFLPAYSARSCATTLGEDVLTKYFKVRLMRSQGQHNQVSILKNHQSRLALSVSTRTKP